MFRKIPPKGCQAFTFMPTSNKAAKGESYTMKKGNRITWVALYMLMWATSNFLPEAFIDPPVFNIAHRGASGHAPEHTLPAYQQAVEMQTDYIEIDLQQTTDGSFVAFHDEELSRTTSGQGKLKDITIDDLKALDAGSWFNQLYPEKFNQDYKDLQVPLLEEIIQCLHPDVSFYIEIKETKEGAMDQLLALLNKYELIESNRVVLQSFDEDVLKKMHELEPAIPLVQLIHQDRLSSIDYQQVYEYAIGAGVAHSLLNQQRVKQIRQAGLLVYAYTVNKEEDMKRLMEWGVKGLFTDYPDRLEHVKKSLDKP